VAGSRSTTEAAARRSLGAAVRQLDRNERLAATGALVVVASMFLPWYGFPFNRDLVTTGFGAFTFIQAALLVTVGAACLLMLEHGRGLILPRPVHEGTLLLIAGAWSALLCVYAMFDRPTVSRGGFDHSYGLRYGVVVALAGAAVLVVAGMRRRHDELTAEHARGAGKAPPRGRRGGQGVR
jgi:hypothetical protein